MRETGHLIPNTTVMNQAMDNAHLRPIPDCFLMAEALEEEYQRWKEKANGVVEIRQECIDNIGTNFQWDDKRALLERLFKETLENG